VSAGAAEAADVQELEELAAPMKRWAQRLLKGVGVVTVVGGVIAGVISGGGGSGPTDPSPPDNCRDTTGVIVCQ
jgi:hypothetical protein